MDTKGIVVAGVDGSPEARVALEFALAEAARRGARLHVVAAVQLPDYWGASYGLGPIGMGIPPARGELVDETQADAQRMVDEVVAANADHAAKVEITVDVRTGRPVDVLVEASSGADLLVVGHRGRGGFSSAVLGSVGLGCVLHATCPVTIARRAPVAASVPATARTVPAEA